MQDRSAGSSSGILLATGIHVYVFDCRCSTYKFINFSATGGRTDEVLASSGAVCSSCCRSRVHCSAPRGQPPSGEDSMTTCEKAHRAPSAVCFFVMWTCTGAPNLRARASANSASCCDMKLQIAQKDWGTVPQLHPTLWCKMQQELGGLPYHWYLKK